MPLDTELALEGLSQTLKCDFLHGGLLSMAVLLTYKLNSNAMRTVPYNCAKVFEQTFGIILMIRQL